MGLFDIFKKAAAPQKPEALSVSCPAGSILAPVAGKAIALEKVSDMVFNSGAMGKGCGIEPSEEVLIHVGVDTVEMAGEGFTVYATKGAHVSAGEPLLSFSKQKIAAAGHDTVVIMALTNTDDLASVELVHEGDVKAGEVVVKFSA